MILANAQAPSWVGVRNTSSIGAWLNSLDQRPPWYWTYKQTTRKNTAWNYNRVIGIPIQHQKGFNLIVLLVVVGLRVAPGKFLCCTFSYHYDGWSLSGLRGLGEYSIIQYKVYIIGNAILYLWNPLGNSIWKDRNIND